MPRAARAAHPSGRLQLGRETLQQPARLQAQLRTFMRASRSFNASATGMRLRTIVEIALEPRRSASPASTSRAGDAAGPRSAAARARQPAPFSSASATAAPARPHRLRAPRPGPGIVGDRSDPRALQLDLVHPGSDFEHPRGRARRRSAEEHQQPVHQCHRRVPPGASTRPRAAPLPGASPRRIDSSDAAWARRLRGGGPEQKPNGGVGDERLRAAVQRLRQQPQRRRSPFATREHRERDAGQHHGREHLALPRQQHDDHRRDAGDHSNTCSATSNSIRRALVGVTIEQVQRIAWLLEEQRRKFDAVVDHKVSPRPISTCSTTPPPTSQEHDQQIADDRHQQARRRGCRSSRAGRRLPPPALSRTTPNHHRHRPPIPSSTAPPPGGQSGPDERPSQQQRERRPPAAVVDVLRSSGSRRTCQPNARPARAQRRSPRLRRRYSPTARAAPRPRAARAGRSRAPPA